MSRGNDRFENPLVTRLRELSDEMKKEAKRSNPDNEKVDQLSREFYATEAELMTENAARREALQRRVDFETGLPTKVQRGHTPVADLDSDPFGEPRSVPVARFDGPWNIEAVMERTTVSGLRSRALSAIETMPESSSATRENATRMVERFDDQAGNLSRLAIAASSPDYMRAFVELARG